MADESDSDSDNEADEASTMSTAPAGEAISFRDEHDEVGCKAISFWFLGVAGVVLMLFSWLRQDVRFLMAGLLCYFLYLTDMCCSKPCSYLTNIQSESKFAEYIQKLQKASPIIEFHIQNYHYETEHHKNGKRTRTRRVKTHSASATFPMTGFSDETLSPDQTIAMFHLLHHKGVKEEQGLLHETVFHGDTGEKKLILTCRFPLQFLPRDAATEAQFSRFREDFYQRNSTDIMQEKKETIRLDFPHRQFAMVVMSSAGSGDAETPWWMSWSWHVLSHLCFLGLPFRMYLYSNTQKVVWHVRKHFSVLPQQQWQSIPMKSWQHSKSSMVSSIARMTSAARYSELEPGGVAGAFQKEDDTVCLDLEAMSGSMAVLLPNYWKATDSSQDFSSMEMLDSSDAMQSRIQYLLDECFVMKSTRDRGGKMPCRLVVEMIQRLEHHALWKRYVEKRRMMQLKRGEVTAVEDMAGSGACKTTKALKGLNHRLESEVNELYLFHGSSPAGVLGIGQHGFNLQLTGSATGCMFGPGAYFSEASSKCDEYAREDPSGLFSGRCALLLCRVSCGELFRLEESDVTAIQRAMGTGRYDGVLGDRERGAGTYREFVVYDEAQVYPEYIIIYRREFND